MNLFFCAEINLQLQKCLNLLQTVFGADLLAVYLYGSALVGGLQKYSDLDLFVVIARPISLEQKRILVTNLLEISGIYMKGSLRPIELTVVQLAAINPWQFPPKCDFQYGEWLRDEILAGNLNLEVSQVMPDLAIIITQILLKSSTLFGAEPSLLLSKVPRRDFIQAMLSDLDRLVLDLQSDTRNVLLTLARIWSTAETNLIRSKPAAADWAIKHLPSIYQPVMIRAKKICVGELAEEWQDLLPLLNPCAEFMVLKIKELPCLINSSLQEISLAEEAI